MTARRKGRADRWSPEMVRDLAQRMRSARAAERSSAVEQAHFLATHHPDVDLAPTVPVLVELYAADENPRLRLAAVATLHAIKDEEGMRGVGRHLAAQTDRYVQIISIAALRDFFEMESSFSSSDLKALTHAVVESLKMSADRNSPPDD